MSAAQPTLDKPQATCAVRGLVKPGAMCPKVIVGGILCGHDGPCRHKVEAAAAEPTTLELKVGHTYRAKRPAAVGDFLSPLVNDRTIRWIGLDSVQYDGPSVSFGRHYPKVSIEAFQKWAARDVTAELPEGNYAPWPIANATRSSS